MLQPTSSIESKASWVVAIACVFVVGTAFGAPWLVTVALKQIATEMGGARSIPSAAVALSWFGAACGGIAMGRVAERVGVRYTVLFGSAMIALGLFIASRGEVWQLYVGYGLFVGTIGIGGINAPLYVYVTRWFDRRRVDLQRNLCRRRLLAAHIRARDCLCWLAAGDAVVRNTRNRFHRSAFDHLSQGAAGTAGVDATKYWGPPR
jgi:MFS family permease